MNASFILIKFADVCINLSILLLQLCQIFFLSKNNKSQKIIFQYKNKKKSHLTQCFRNDWGASGNGLLNKRWSNTTRLDLIHLFASYSCQILSNLCALNWNCANIFFEKKNSSLYVYTRKWIECEVKQENRFPIKVTFYWYSFVTRMWVRWNVSF